MALTFGSIISRYSSINEDKLDPVDRAYLDECRRNSGNAFLHAAIDGKRLSCSKTSLNPYHESFKVAQSQLLLQQQIITKHNQRQMKWSWKHTAILTLVLASLIAAIIATACIYAGDVRHGHYVRFFSLLIGILLGSCILVAIATKLYPCLARSLKARQQPTSVDNKLTNQESKDSNSELSNQTANCIVITVEDTK